MLQIEHLTKKFGPFTAVNDVTLSIEPGSFIGLIGRSGAGKSTFLRMINRLGEPTSGQIFYKNRNITNLQGRDLRQWRRSCAMIFQQFNLVGRLDVLTNVLTGRLSYASHLRSLLNSWTVEEKMMAMAALNQFDMASFASQTVDSLSGGQQQRVAICRALVQEPDLILADEPIASLDPRNTKVVMDGLARINKDYGITVLCNLHSLDIARTYCDRLIGLSAGSVVFDGRPETLTDDIAQSIYGVEASSVLEIAPTQSCDHSLTNSAAA